MANRVQKGGAAVALVALVSTAEGVRQNAYPDPATQGRPWSICYGHTEGVRPGDHHSLDECKALLRIDLATYSDGVEACTMPHLPDGAWVAFVSFAYNLGVARYCKSIAPIVNGGHLAAACNALLKYHFAAGVPFPGLLKRRERERDLCMREAV